MMTYMLHVNISFKSILIMLHVNTMTRGGGGVAEVCHPIFSSCSLLPHSIQPENVSVFLAFRTKKVGMMAYSYPNIQDKSCQHSSKLCRHEI